MMRKSHTRVECAVSSGSGLEFDAPGNIKLGPGDFVRLELRPLSRLALALRIGCAAVIAAPVLLASTVSHARSDRVRFDKYAAGTIVVKTNERHLYYVLGDGFALRYPVGVGKAGKAWQGDSYIAGKYIKPGWRPPEEIKHDKPSIPDLIPGGSPENPMGAAAMTIAGGEYAIHGTNNPKTIGGFVSYGCIRMYNEDIMDLYDRVSTGTKVVVVR